MTKLNPLHFEQPIDAPVEVVWATMFDPEYYTKWTEPFSEGAVYEGTWERGSKIRFITPSGDGMSAEITENIKHNLIVIHYLGCIVNGEVNTTDEETRHWVGANEQYCFTETQQGTLLEITQDSLPDFEEFMSDAWVKALKIIKTLSEKQ